MPYTMRSDHPSCDGYAVVKSDSGDIVPGGCHKTREQAAAHLAALKANVEDAMIAEIDGKIYATARAFVVSSPEEIPRELAAEYNKNFNPSFVWIAGRYVQANSPNRNGHLWTFDDLQKGEYSIRYTPMNVLHEWDKPVGTVVETKIVHRPEKAAATDRLLPEVQALGVLWAANFPELAHLVKDAHAKRQLWFSMECVAEAKQCMKCEQVYAWATTGPDTCAHLASDPKAPRRFINPTFLGAALIFPPERPAWKDADITEVARTLTEEYAHRTRPSFEVEEWTRLMSMVQPH